MTTDLGDLLVRIKADVSNLEKGLRQANALSDSSAKKMQGAFAGVAGQLKGLIPAVTVAALVSFTRHAINAGDAINDMAQRTGIAVETLSKFELVAKQNGTSLEGFANSIKFLQRNMAEAAQGNKTAVDAFRQIGLSIEELRGLSPDEAFLAVIDRLNELGDASDFTKAGMDIMGRGFSEIAVVARQGADGIREAMQRAEELGLVLSAEDAARMDEFNDKWEEMTLIVRRLAQEGFIAAADAVTLLKRHLEELKEGLPSTNRLLNELGLGMIAVGEAFGLVDEGTTALAADEAAERLSGGGKKGPTKITITKPRGMRRLTPADSGKKKEAEDYDKAGDALSNYLTQLENERELAGLTGKAQAMRRAELEATALAIKDNTLLGPEMAEQIRQEISATYDMEEAQKKLNEAQQEAARFSQELKDKLSESLSSIILDFDNATDAAKRFADALAKTILERKVTGPLAESIIGGIDGSGFLGSLFGGESARPSADFVGPMPSGGVLSGIGSFFGFADGGRPPVGRPSLVGERGPELFVPDAAGTVIPNHALGKQNNVTVVYNISPGVQGTVRAELMQAMPAITAQTKNAVFAAIERGGSEARAVGRRG